MTAQRKDQIYTNCKFQNNYKAKTYPSYVPVMLEAFTSKRTGLDIFGLEVVFFDFSRSLFFDFFSIFSSKIIEYLVFGHWLLENIIRFQGTLTYDAYISEISMVTRHQNQ